ncbi:hypothetical protein MACK_002860 [Theileria orientalis]|uniref:SURF1-like protein n=1 Tax=Theileria orientalis TaxID=68886 RepID=A0A976ME87_THEOR|nr:hypothetical protein MACK_002860 [Theileria orientalis]
MFIGRFTNSLFKTTSGFYYFKIYKRISHSNTRIGINCVESKYVYTYYSTKVTVCNDSELTDNKTDNSLTFDESGVIKCTKDQWLYKPTAKEVDLFLNSKIIPSKPIDLENSVVVNLVDLNKHVTSPVKNAVLFSEYGIRKGESLRLFIGWLLFTSVTTYLGIWQLNRKKWKEDLLDNIKQSLSMPKITITSVADIKSKEKENGSNGLVYRIIETHGVLDTEHQFLVGPRQSMLHEHGEQSGYYVLYPLRFRDGTAILLNMGWLKGDEAFNMKSTPEWVTVRGVLVRGEIGDRVIISLKYKFLSMVEKILFALTKFQIDLTKVVNKPSSIVRDSDKKAYRYLDPDNIASQIYSTEPSVTQRYILNVYDSYYDDDKTPIDNTDKQSDKSTTLMNRMIKIAGITKSVDSSNSNTAVLPRYNFQRKGKSDYLLFYADPGTHFNYAMQWFLMAISITCMCIYKLFRVRRVLKRLNL